MKKHFLYLIFILSGNLLMSQKHQDVIMLNGIADYEQTEFAFPPEKFDYKIPVPGLIDLAEPRLEQYDKYFSGKQSLKYHWYRFSFRVPPKFENKFATLVLLKSMFNTQIILNGYDCGTYMQCSTPIETNLTPYLRFNNEENILLVRVGEEKRIPWESAMGFDREKFAYIPGIWDDIFINFTGPVRIARTLILSDYNKKEVTVKLKIENVSKIFQRNMEFAYTDYTITGFIREKKSGKRVTGDFVIHDKVKSQLENTNEITVPVLNPVPWSPENPFLYEMVLTATGCL
jgi:beta-galactosidase